MLPVLVAVLTLSLLIIAHELGHFLAARAAGVKVEEFGVGLPPRIAGKKGKSGTLFSLNWLPLGGFVRMKGQDDFAAEEISNEDLDSFTAKGLLPRAAILAAGVFANWLLAIALFAGSFLLGVTPPAGSSLAEKQVEKNPPRLLFEKVLEDSAAAEAGILPGDFLKSVDGTPISSVESFREALALAQSTADSKQQTAKVSLSLERAGKEISLLLQPREGKAGVFLLPGVELKKEKLPLGAALGEGFRETNRLAAETFRGLGRLLASIFSRGEIPAGVAGPVGIVALLGDAAEGGAAALLQFAALLSISLAVLNALPIPALDGGRLLFLLAEGILGGRKILTERVENWLHLGGFAAILLFLLAVTWHDLAGLF